MSSCHFKRKVISSVLLHLRCPSKHSCELELAVIRPVTSVPACSNNSIDYQKPRYMVSPLPGTGWHHLWTVEHTLDWLLICAFVFDLFPSGIDRQFPPLDPRSLPVSHRHTAPLWFVADSGSYSIRRNEYWFLARPPVASAWNALASRTILEDRGGTKKKIFIGGINTETKIDVAEESCIELEWILSDQTEVPGVGYSCSSSSLSFPIEDLEYDFTGVQRTTTTDSTTNRFIATRLRNSFFNSPAAKGLDPSISDIFFLTLWWLFFLIRVYSCTVRIKKKVIHFQRPIVLKSIDLNICTWPISKEQLILFPLVPFLHHVCHTWPSSLPLKMTMSYPTFCKFW